MRIVLLLLQTLILLPSLALASTSLVDLLSASPEHSLLLRAFQRARLIPVLNQLNSSTLFAPTNEAIRRRAARERTNDENEERGPEPWSLILSERLEDFAPAHDNLQLRLQETLLYHCLNYTLFSPPPSEPPSNSSSRQAPKVPDESLPFNEVTLQETLYYPSLDSYRDQFPHEPSLPGSPPEDERSKFPLTRPRGLLERYGQKLRVVRRQTAQSNLKDKSGRTRGEKEQDEEDEIWIGVDWKGNGGIKVGDKSGLGLQWAKNGVLVPIDGVLERPKDLASIIQSIPSLSTFASLLPPSLIDYLSNTSHLTVFAPTNEAWKGVSELEMRYLRSQFSELDIEEILQDSSTRKAVTSWRDGPHGEKRVGIVGYLGKMQVGGDGDGERQVSITTTRNNTLEIEKNEGGEISVNGTQVEEGDILAANGVLHTLPSLLLPSGSLALTAEKYLLALNCTKFVSLLHSVNLSDYVQIPSKDQDTTILPDPLPHLTTLGPQISLSAGQSNDDQGDKPGKKGYTILALKDSLIDSINDPETSIRLLTLPAFPDPGSKELHSLLSYHILPSRLSPKELADGTLVGTELRPDTLKGTRQKIMITVQSEEGGEGEGWEKGKKDRSGDKEAIISFGNANAIAEPVEVGNSIIYLISTILEPPTSIISTAVSDLRLSTFVASVFSSHLDKTFLTTPSITYLIPTNQAFERLGLVMSYLLLPTATQELENLLRYHALDELVYSQDFPRRDRTRGSTRFPTLENGGSEIYLERDDNSTLSVHGPTLGGFAANGEPRDAKVIEADQLIETGVLHVLDQVELPPTLEVTVDKLMKGAKSTTMVELIKEANMSWVLEGKEPSRDREEDTINSYDEDEDRGDVRRAYTILCPTDKALSRLNLTYYLTHPQQLSELIKLHIIPTDAILSKESPTSLPSGGGRGGQLAQGGGNEEEGTPLLLSDSITYSTLHSKEQGGKSKYGKVAFKRWGAERGSWMVGIEGARGTKGESDSARVVNWGRATPWILRDNDVVGQRMMTTKVAAGGGVILIDSVLLPWEPGWFRSWGWIVVAALVGASIVFLLGVWGIRKWKRRSRKNGEGYERVEGEED